MSQQRHREVNAKVEGRDPPEMAPKKTMEPFKSLMERLLKVPMNEVAEQQALFDQSKKNHNSTKAKIKKRPKLKPSQVAISPEGAHNQKDKGR